MGIVIFNGWSSADLGIVVEHPPGYQTPQRDYDMVHIPGRNGDLVIDSGSYQNVERTYQIAIGNRLEKFAEMANRIAEWLHNAKGYARLEDSYEPEYYRLALYSNSADIENILQHAGRTTISFNCKPQRFLKSGDETLQITETTKIKNPTGFTALPIITVYGSGSGVLNVGDYKVSLTDINGYVVIDSDIQDVYKGSDNKNPTATFTDGGFPKLVAGENRISFTNGITKVEVVPKWWTL